MSRKLLVLVFAAIILVHVAGAIYAAVKIEDFWQVDTNAYFGLAQSLLQNGRYVHPTDPDEDLFRPPVYPLFLAAVMAFSRGSLAAVPVIQTILYFLSAYLLFQSAQMLSNQRAGIAAALLYLVNPNSTFWSYAILTETLSGFWLVCAVFLITKYWSTAQQRWSWLAGVSLGLGALTRPILFPLALIWLAIFVWLAWRRKMPGSTRQGWQAVLLLGLGCFLVVTPWQARNYLVHRQYTISTVGTNTLLYWNMAKILEQAEGYSFEEAQKLIDRSANPIQFSLDLIRRYPVIAVKEQVKGVVRTLLGAEYDTWATIYTRQRTAQSGIMSILFAGGDPASLRDNLSALSASPWFWAGLAALVYDGILYLAGIAGLYRCWKQREKTRTLELAVMLVIGILYLVLSPLASGDSRFRVPADPLLAMLAGFAWQPRSNHVNNPLPIMVESRSPV